MRILFLTNLVPYPLDNGGKIKTYSTIKALKELGHDIDVLCFTEEHNADERSISELKKICESINTVYLKLTTSENKKYMMGVAFKSLFSKLSFGVYKYKSQEMCQRIRKMLQENSYDMVYFDHLQMCVYHPMIRKELPGARYVLDEHNCEYLIMKRHMDNSRNALKKAFLCMEYKKLRHFELGNVRNFDMTCFVSEEDKQNICSQIKEKVNARAIPICVLEQKRKDVTNFCKDGILRILFLGTLTWAPNNEGLVWFLKEVVPLLEESSLKYEMYIVGKNPSEEVKSLCQNYGNIIVTGYVESTEEYFEKCDCMVVPLFIGSGQRVKIIESFSRGFPVISTSIGAEGLAYKDGESILIADTKEKFVDKIDEILDAGVYSGLAEESYRIYEGMYSFGAFKGMIKEAIEEQRCR